MTKVYFECRNVKSSWVESTDVKSLDTAEEEIKEIVNQFNNTLRPHEKPREFIKLVAQKSSPLEEMGHIIVGRKVVGGYRALKYSNGGIFAWVDAEKIKSKQGLLNLKTEDDLHNLKFRCPGNINTMNLMKAKWINEYHQNIKGVVIFARGECPDWVTPIFQMW